MSAISTPTVLKYAPNDSSQGRNCGLVLSYGEDTRTNKGSFLQDSRRTTLNASL